MLVRFVLLVPALLGLALSTATDAEAKRFKLFSFPKATAKPSPVEAARPTASPSPAPAASATAAAPTGRSGGFVFVPGARIPAASQPAEERAPDEVRPMLATSPEPPLRKPAPTPEKPATAPEPTRPVLTTVMATSSPEKPTPAFRVQTVSAQGPGFEVVKPRN
jgi:hypothetical protein